MVHLNGEFNKKLGLLLLGNVTGLVWNYLFHVFSVNALASFDNFSVVYTIVYPFLNSLWVISFWSISLTFLRRQNITGKSDF